MFSIRNGVFETNSSSSHSICINNSMGNVSIDTDEVIDKLNGVGVWKLNDKDISYYRAPFRYLGSFSQKVLYAIAVGSFSIEEIEKIVRKYVPEFTVFRFESKDKWYGTDEDILSGFLAVNKITLEEFLTNDKYFVICDGDEYNIYSGMVHAGLIRNSITDYPREGDFNNEC